MVPELLLLRPSFARQREEMAQSYICLRRMSESKIIIYINQFQLLFKGQPVFQEPCPELLACFGVDFFEKEILSQTVGRMTD